MDLKQAAKSIKTELQVYRLVARDPRTPWLSRVLLAAAIGYVVMPFDLIPDFLPVIGQLDDFIIVPGLVILALKLLPDGLVDDCRRRVTLNDA